MYKTILVPVDMAFTEKAKVMIDVAKAQSGKDTQIILLNVIEELPTWVTVELPNDILGEPRKFARDELNAISNATAINAVVEIRTGRPYKTILEVAGETDTDLIIIASHQPGLEDYFLGSTASKVVRHAKCSVLVIR